MERRGVAIVTGASSGIGRSGAVELARRGYAVVLAARRPDRLAEVADECRQAGAPDEEVLIVPTDVSREEQVEALVARAVERLGRIDVMVNNAGFGVHARVHETTEEQMRELFDVNFFGVFYGCKAVAPVMMRQRSGHIFNISSVIGKRGCPFNGGYSASKFAVGGLTEAMRVEMMPYGVRVTLVCPGLTDTEFFRHVRGGTSLNRTSYARVRGLMKPQKIARAIVRAIGRNRPEMVFSLGGKILVWLNARFPRFTDRLMKLYHDDLMKSHTS